MSKLTPVEVDGRKGMMGLMNAETGLYEIVFEDGMRITFFGDKEEELPPGDDQL